MKLCSACSECIPALRPRRLADHHSTFRSFVAAIELDCSLCSELLAQLSPEQQEELLSHGAEWEAKSPNVKFTMMQSFMAQEPYVAGPRRSFQLGIGFGDSVADLLGDIARANKTSVIYPALFVVLQPVEDVDISLLANPISTSTESDESWAVAREWIKNCLDSHEVCNSSMLDNYPSRLLELPKFDSELVLVPLVIPSLENVEGSYATLSHRWGGADMFKLMTSNFADCRKGIPIQRLSQMLQETIRVVIRLRIRYLWVDCLCIFQDDGDSRDWRVECSRMEQYCGNAFINISATASRNGSQGLFRERKPDKLRHERLSISISSEPAREYVVTQLSGLDVALRGSILNTRAWVLQERLLARRVLHFCHDQVFWECCELTASETYPQGFPPNSLLQGVVNCKDLNPYSKWNRQNYANASTHDISYLLWENLKEIYSSCHITRASDKSTAIAGLASRFERVLQDQYIAGMWKAQLPHQLLWRVWTSIYPLRSELTVEKQDFQVPSFSWLSVNCPIQGNVRDVLTKTVEGELLLQVGQIQAPANGSVVDPVRAITLLPKFALKVCDLVLGDDSFVHAYALDRPANRRLESAKVYLDRNYEQLQKPGDRLRAEFLPIRKSLQHSIDKKGVDTLEGLLLQPVRAPTNTYRRLGYMSVHTSEDIDTRLRSKHPWLRKIMLSHSSSKARGKAQSRIIELC